MPRNRNLLQPSPLKRPLDEEFAFDLAGGKKSKIVKGAEAGNQSSSKSTEIQQEERQRSQSAIAVNTKENQDDSVDNVEHSAVPEIQSVVIVDQSQTDGEPVSHTAAAISPGSTERRNFSLEALFQVTDTELQNITKQRPGVQQAQVVPSEVDQSKARRSEVSQENTEGLIGEPGVYREAVKIPVTESGVEKYQLKSDTLEQQGLKLVYIKQTGDISDDGSSSSGKPKFPLTKSHQQAVDKLLQKASGENISGRKRKHPQKPGRHVCTYCGRRCAKPSVLEKHIRAHTGERPYPCLVCGFSFKTKSNLNKHCKSRAHAIKTNFEEKKRRLGSDEQDADVPRVALELEIGDDEIGDEYISDDSATESGEEEIEEIDRRTQAPSHVLQEVAKFLERSRENRPKVETPKGLSQLERTKSVTESDLDTVDFSGKKSILQNSGVQLMPSQTTVYPKIAPKQVEEQSELPPPCKTDEWKHQFSQTISPSDRSSVLLTNCNQGKQSYNEVEVVNLPSPNTDAETSTKALRNLEKLSEKFEIAAKEGVRLSTSVHTLENKHVQVMIQLQQPAGRAQKIRRCFSEQPSVSSEKSFPKEPSVSLAALRDRIQQLISANEAIVDTPKIDPPRPKLAKRLGRQNSESGISYRSESVEAVSSISNVFSSSGISANPGQPMSVESLFDSTDTGTRGTPQVSLTQDQINVIVSHFQDWKGESSTGQVSKGSNSLCQVSKGDNLIFIGQETAGLGNRSWNAQAIKTESVKKTEGEKEISVSVGQFILPGTSSVPLLITNSNAVVMPVNKSTQPSVGLTLVQSMITSAQQQQHKQQQQKLEFLGTQQIQSKPDSLSGSLHRVQVSQSGDIGPSLIYTLPMPNMQTNTSETSSKPVLIVSASAGEKQRSGQTNLQKQIMVTSTAESVSVSNTKFKISESKPGPNPSVNSAVIHVPYQTVSLSELPQNINVALSQTRSSALHPAIVRSRSLSRSEPFMNPAANTKTITQISTPTSIKPVNMFTPPVTSGSGVFIAVPQAVSKPGQKLATSQTASLTPQKVVTLDKSEQIKLLSALLPTKVSAEVKGDNSKHRNEPQEIKIEFKLNKGSGAPGSSNILSSGHVHDTPSIRFQTANISSKSTCMREPSTPVGPVFRFQNAAISSSHNNQSTVILTPSQVMTSFKHTSNPVVLTQKSVDVSSPSSRMAHPVFRFQTPTSTLPQKGSLPGNVIQINDGSTIKNLLLKSKQGEPTHFSTPSAHCKQVASKVILASDDEYGPYRCSFCNTSFLKEQTLELHKTYYCKEKPVSLANQHGSMGSDDGNTIDKEAVAKLFASAGVTMRVNTDKDDETETQEIEQNQDGVPKSSLIFENFEPTIWPKKKVKPKTLRSKSQSFSVSSLPGFEGQKDWATLLPVAHQDTVGIPIIITDIPVTSFSVAHSSQESNFIPLSQASTNSSAESSLSQSVYRENKQSEWKPKLKGQILMRKLKKKVLMKRSLSLDQTVMERSSENESTQCLASGDYHLRKTKSVVETRKSKELYDGGHLDRNTGSPNKKEQLKILRFSRSESVPRTEEEAREDHDSRPVESSDDVVFVEVTGSTQETQDKTEVTWQLKNVHVPVVLAQPFLDPLMSVTPIYQSNHLAHPGGLVCCFSTDIHMAVLRSSHGKIPASLLGKFNGLLVPATPLEKQIPVSVNNSVTIPVLIGARPQSKPLNISEPSSEDKLRKNDGGGNSTAESSAEKMKDLTSSEGTTSTKIQYLYGHSYPSLRGGTYVTFCCLQRPQPMYVLVGNNKRVSMYSNWRTAQKDPNPYGLTTKMLLSLYDSHCAGNPVFVTSKETSPTKGLVTHSSYWTYKQKQVLNMGPVSGSNKIQIKNVINIHKITQDKPTDSKISLKQVGPSGKDRQGNIVLKKEDSQEKIIKGGFKSLDPYVYVRGRGRGKYVCQTCGIRCKKPSMLKKHIRTHTDFRPYHCRHCRFSFKTKGNLTKHMKSKSHQKRCMELGIVPVPTAIDDSQIDQSALAAQFAMTKDAKIADLFDCVDDNEELEEDVDKDGEEEEDMEDEEEVEGEGDEGTEEEDIDEGDNEDLGKVNDEEVDVPKSFTQESLSTSKECDVNIIVHSVGTSSPQVTCSSQMNRNLFLQTLGIVAKQLVNGDEPTHVPVSVTRLVNCSQQSEVSTEFVGVTGKQTFLIASRLSTVYGFGGGELSKEGDAEKKKKDSEIAYSLLNLSEQNKSTQGGGDNPKTTVQFVNLTKTSPAITRTDVAETPKGGSYSADNVKNTTVAMVTIPLGGFVPPIQATPINVQSSDQLKSLLKSGPIVGQLIRQETGKLDFTSESSTTTVFIPFQFSHPFSGSEIIISPVKVGNSHEFAILSPVKKSSSTETLLMSHQNTACISKEPVILSQACISHSIKSPASDTLVTSHPLCQNENTLVLASLKPGNNEDGSFHVVRTQPVCERSSAENKLNLKNESSPLVDNPSTVMGIFPQDHKERTLTGATGNEPVWSHIDLRGPTGMEKFICSNCGKHFPEKQQLILHYNAHIIENPFRCGTCSVSFKAESQLHKHFSSEQHLLTVVKNTEGTDILAENPRPFRCDLCQTAFRIKGHLVKHFRSKAHFNSIESTGKLAVGSYEKVEKFLNYINTPDHEEFMEAVKAVISGDCSKLKIEPGEKALEDVQSLFNDIDSFPTATFPDGGRCQGHIVVIETESLENQNVMEQISHGHFQKHLKKVYEVPTLGSGERVRVELNSDYIELGEISCNNRANVSDDSCSERDMGDISDKNLETSGNYVRRVTTEDKFATLNVQGTSPVCSTGKVTVLGDTACNPAVTSGGSTPVDTSQGGIILADFRGTTTQGVTTSGVTMHTIVPQDGTTVSHISSIVNRSTDVTSGVATVTRTTMSVVTEGPHLCGICRQGFKDINMLKNHLITHAELRPYVCEYCDAGFTNAQSLKIHLNTHTQESPYVCGLCGNTFAKLEQLRNHSHDHLLNLKQLTADKGQSSSESSKIKGHDKKEKKNIEVTSSS
ncbi:hypothetical protein CHS0354_032192 [Potamilus streckersoni]|uniref:C2H2-type domain-containing protein n=1 Tax=Potamilus streckersoni TaxID=2493646 RepID=A0AAE0WDZ7_9BIVA|nr:hypothetical protein CHS0354_032192 [Potamilus streckersoni]